MTLKIEKHLTGRLTTLCLIGHLQLQHLEELQDHMKRTGGQIVLDLEQLTLVDMAAVRFLGACECDGVTLRGCAPYVREWIEREKEQAP